MANIESILRQMNNENNAKTFAFNSSEAQKARDFQASMSNTSHQREVEDLKRAGINPVLSANGGAQAYSASSASGSADNSAVGALASIYQTKMNNDNAAKIARQQKSIDLQIAKINAAASNYAANKAYAASRYASENSYASAIYNTDVSSATSRANSKRQYRSTDAGMIDSLGFGKTGNKVAKGSYIGLKSLGGIIGRFLSRH